MSNAQKTTMIALGAALLTLSVVGMTLNPTLLSAALMMFAVLAPGLVLPLLIGLIEAGVDAARERGALES